jgi:integrase/recombinase XerC/integrase/recombinase XerD
VPAEAARVEPLAYSDAHHRCSGTALQREPRSTFHQLRHPHATELINARVSIEVVRKQLGRASTDPQVYALLADEVADDEIRAARRRR